MSTYKELRAEAWKNLRSGGWVGKYFVTMMTVALFSVLVMRICTAVFESCEMQTWSMFMEAKLKALSAGLDLAVPSRAIMYRMHMATLFETFLSCITSGICYFAMAALFLCAARGGRQWFKGSLGGFARPLDVAWLCFRYGLQVWLWSLLFIIPGIIAIYRYWQCWNLKVDHPDWSAGKCLAESGKMMHGNKWRLFCFQCSYWRPITLWLVFVLLVMVLFLGLSGSGGAAVPGGLALWTLPLGAINIAIMLFLTVYLGIGQALFYLQLSAPPASPEPTQSVA